MQRDKAIALLALAVSLTTYLFLALTVAGNFDRLTQGELRVLAPHHHLPALVVAALLFAATHAVLTRGALPAQLRSLALALASKLRLVAPSVVSFVLALRLAARGRKRPKTTRRAPSSPPAECLVDGFVFPERSLAQQEMPVLIQLARLARGRAHYPSPCRVNVLPGDTALHALLDYLTNGPEVQHLPGIAEFEIEGFLFSFRGDSQEAREFAGHIDTVNRFAKLARTLAPGLPPLVNLTYMLALSKLSPAETLRTYVSAAAGVDITKSEPRT